MRRIFSTQNQIVNQVKIFFSTGTSWSTDICKSVDCVGISDIFQQLVNATFCPAFVLEFIH